MLINFVHNRLFSVFNFIISSSTGSSSSFRFTREFLFFTYILIFLLIQSPLLCFFFSLMPGVFSIQRPFSFRRSLLLICLHNLSFFLFVQIRSFFDSEFNSLFHYNRFFDHQLAGLSSRCYRRHCRRRCRNGARSPPGIQGRHKKEEKNTFQRL